MPLRDSIRPILLLAGSFGIVAFVAVAPSPHFLGYALMGLTVAAAAALTPVPSA